MLDAIALGALAQVSLLLSGLFATWVTVPRRIVGWLAGFGAGAMISAIAFDLIEEQASVLGGLEMTAWLLAGAVVFIVGDGVVDRIFAGRQSVGPPGAGSGPVGPPGSGDALGIVVGSVVDGVPESLIFGIQIAAGMPVSGTFLAAVMVSNVPQSLAPSAELVAGGWTRRALAILWTLVVGACGLAAGLGFLLGSAAGGTGARLAALAAGGLLSMLTDSLMPFAFEHGGDLAGLWTVVGFAMAVAASLS